MGEREPSLALLKRGGALIQGSLCSPLISGDIFGTRLELVKGEWGSIESLCHFVTIGRGERNY